MPGINYDRYTDSLRKHIDTSHNVFYIQYL